VKRLCRAHKDVVATVLAIKAKLRCHFLVVIDNVVGLFFWRAPGLLGCALDIDAVLVRARQKQRVDSSLSFCTSNSVSHDHRVKVTEMRQTVSVIDRRCDVEGFHLVIGER